MPAVQKPPSLKPGDTIAVVAPGSPVTRESLAAGAGELERMGYKVRYRQDIFAANGFFAGSHERRRTEFLEALADPTVDAIFCARGGYGCNYVAQALAAAPLPATPKIVMGYSDITTLQMLLWKRAGWSTFHGPMVSIDLNAGYDAPSLRQATTSTGPWEVGRAPQVLRRGDTEGVLLGGCLSILVTALGTPREIDFHGAVLFLEDLDERPYRVDRMLFHLREAGKLEGVRAIVFGEMKGCQASEGKTPLEEVIVAALEGVNVPILFGLRSGHVSGGNICLPLGVRAAVSGDTLALLEGAVR
jgi:muramoyltetrapeptide carboxypeptidase